MSWQNARATSLRVAAGLSGGLLMVAAVLYAPIGLGTESPPEMVVRTHALWAVLAVSAVATWLVAIKPDSRFPRLASSLTAAFNGIWIFSFVGLPVVVASLVAVSVSAIGAPRRVMVPVLALALVGLGLGLVFLWLTAPPGEHIFG